MWNTEVSKEEKRKVQSLKQEVGAPVSFQLIACGSANSLINS